MAYNEQLAGRIGDLVGARAGMIPKKMFGGIAYMLNGNMCCGIIGDELMVRVGQHAFDEALAEPHARPMDFTGRPMKGMIYVGPEGTSSDGELLSWVERGIAFAESLPPK